MQKVKQAALNEIRAALILLLMVGSYGAGTTQTDCFGWLREIMHRSEAGK